MTETLGKRLSSLILEKGEATSFLADSLNIKEEVLFEILKDEKRPSLKLIFKLSEELSVPFSSLLRKEYSESVYIPDEDIPEERKVLRIYLSDGKEKIRINLPLRAALIIKNSGKLEKFLPADIKEKVNLDELFFFIGKGALGRLFYKEISGRKIKISAERV